MILSRRETPTNSHNAEDLRQQVDDAIARGADWLEIWTLYSEHHWFQQQLQFGAAKALRRLHAPLEWSADVRQEALLHMGTLLQRDKTLGFDSSRGSFTGWIYVLVHTCCLKALRQFRDSKRMRSLPMIDRRSERPMDLIQKRIELIEEIQQLEPASRELLVRYLQGASVDQLARARGVSARTVYRMIRSSQDRLRRHIDE